MFAAVTHGCFKLLPQELTASRPELVMSVTLRGQSDDSWKEEDLVKIPVLWMLNKIRRSPRFVMWGKASAKAATAGFAAVPGSSGSVTCDTEFM